jgi:hypothetical protein
VTLIHNGFRADNQVAMPTKARLVVVTAVLLLLGATVLPLAAQSLADVAKKEPAESHQKTGEALDQ